MSWRPRSSRSPEGVASVAFKNAYLERTLGDSSCRSEVYSHARRSARPTRGSAAIISPVVQGETHHAGSRASLPVSLTRHTADPHFMPAGEQSRWKFIGPATPLQPTSRRPRRALRAKDKIMSRWLRVSFLCNFLASS